MYFPIIDVLKENFIAKIPSIVTKWLEDNVNPVGSAVVVDTSLSISGAAADAKITGDELTDLKSDLADLKDELKDVENDLGYEIIDLIKNKTIATSSGTNITPDHLTPEEKWCCCCVPCSAGDVFTITGSGGSSTRLWAFSDSSGNVIEPQAGPQDTKTNYKVTAPTGVAYFAFNSRMGTSPYVYKGKKPE